MIAEQILPQLDDEQQAARRRQIILVVDDDVDQAQTLSTALSRQGFNIEVAHSAAAAEMALQRIHPDLILLDIRLPDGNGLQICQRWVDEPSTCDIPVIILSGMERPDIIRCARQAGCRYFLRKPYDPNALLLLAQNAIGGSASPELESRES